MNENGQTTIQEEERMTLDEMLSILDNLSKGANQASSYASSAEDEAEEAKDHADNAMGYLEDAQGAIETASNYADDAMTSARCAMDACDTLEAEIEDLKKKVSILTNLNALISAFCDIQEILLNLPSEVCQAVKDLHLKRAKERGEGL